MNWRDLWRENRADWHRAFRAGCWTAVAYALLVFGLKWAGLW